MVAVTCPHCGKTVEISQAIQRQVEENIASELKKQHEEDIKKLKAEIGEKAKEKAREEFTYRLKDAQNELIETRKRNKDLHEQLLEMNSLIRQLKEQNEKNELTYQKKFNEELENMRERIAKDAQEKARLRELELEKKLHDTQKALEEAKLKTQQTSQQLQGEVSELDVERQLRDAFLYDEFAPIPKGVEGGDIWQKVRNKHGQLAGTILWEIKRTKSWSNSWLPKLREDARRVNASACILVSAVLPDTMEHFGREGTVWVCSNNYSVLLAHILRDCLLQIAIARSSASHKDERLQAIYEYITSEAFRHKFESHFESVRELREDLEAERRAMERIWKKREIQIQRLDRSASQMFGEIEGIVGKSLPPVRSLELSQSPVLVDENTEEANVS